MKTKRFFTAAISIALILTAASVSSFAVTTSKSKGLKAASAKTKPRVVIIRADWCGACQKLEPTMMGLMEEYGGKLDFVMLDVTNDETTAQAAAKARSLGLSAFFEANKKMTSTVAIFKGKKSVFKTAKNFNKADYVAAFEKAIK
ncbi:MAG: thioredoxin family protein [Acidobacteriota bacterium]|nr:MAG: thioredoxin family protein [Acidobacteriota bacterium]